MPKTILCIEDNQEIRENTAELLELEGYDVLVADNGHDGINIARANHPNLIICDVIMIGINGYQVFEILLQDESTRLIPVIFTSAMSESANKKKAFSIGGCHYLIKPYDDKELFAIIAKLLTPTL